MFHVGQKVVCVEDRVAPDLRGREIQGAPWLLKWGEVYTVASVIENCGEGISFDGRYRGEEVVLVEVPGCILLLDSFRVHCAGEGYDARRFRPLKDTSKQVEKLKRQCLPASEREREDA